MEPMTLQATAEDAGKRLDAWLAKQTGLSRMRTLAALESLLERNAIVRQGTGRATKYERS